MSSSIISCWFCCRSYRNFFSDLIWKLGVMNKSLAKHIHETEITLKNTQISLTKRNFNQRFSETYSDVVINGRSTAENHSDVRQKCAENSKFSRSWKHLSEASFPPRVCSAIEIMVISSMFNRINPYENYKRAMSKSWWLLIAEKSAKSRLV